MSEVRFDNQVAVVTGAGGGLGREYALLLAKRGARVLVNDLGADPFGVGADRSYAQKVYDEITASGGIALANGDSVATTKGAESIIGQAVDAWGKVDILINNAGVVRSQGNLDQIKDEDYEFDMSIAAGGTFRMTRAVWKGMKERNYGRILFVSSESVFGMGQAVPYPATKMAVIGMMRTLVSHLVYVNANIKINCIMPAAAGRLSPMMGPIADASMKKYFPVHSVAPVAAYLVHRDIPCNGEIFSVGGGRFGRVFIGMADGYRGSEDITIEEVRNNFHKAMDISDFKVPASTWEVVALNAPGFDWGEAKHWMSR